MKDIMESASSRLELAVPYLSEEELPLLRMPPISRTCIERSYIPIAQVHDYRLVQHHDNMTLIFGFFQEDNLIPITEVTVNRASYPGKVIPTQSTAIWYQVKFVHANKEFAERRLTKLAYETIAAKFYLVSDRKQYWAAKNLWRSVARGNQVNVYVFDGNPSVNDYVRDDAGQVVKYNGQNIPENHIWGRQPEHYNRLLVASVYDRV